MTRFIPQAHKIVPLCIFRAAGSTAGWLGRPSDRPTRLAAVFRVEDVLMPPYHKYSAAKIALTAIFGFQPSSKYLR